MRLCFWCHSTVTRDELERFTLNGTTFTFHRRCVQPWLDAEVVKR